LSSFYCIAFSFHSHLSRLGFVFPMLDGKCFCGYDYDDYTRHGELVAADSCTMVCTGDPTEFCGGWNAISVSYYFVRRM
ncbi:unnamed protein product, partial [Scytosiphon promiscuus]